MQNQILVSAATDKYRSAIIGLLQNESLPVEDLPAQLSHFFIATDNGFIVGAIGLEVYETEGLLRSLVVKPEYRKMMIAAGLITELEKLGKSLGLKSIYLLTQTAENYFSKKGYSKIERNDVPVSLQRSSEFSHVCPSSAIVMKKPL